MIPTAPLAGLRVLELARILAGPWIGQLLADLGADVVKVEAPEGDDTRKWGPPFIEGVDGDNLSAAYFHSANRGKRSITADFRTQEGQALVRRLAAHADVVVENFKVGGLVKYGLDAVSLRKTFPRLIYCSVTGFGQDGPYAPRAGYDFLVQGMGGPMSVTGEPEGAPMKAGYAVADIFTGLYASTGILAALRRRDQTGEGASLDMALLDTQIAVLGNQAMNYLVGGQPPARLGNAHPNIVPYDVFPVADGHIIIATGNDGQWRKLCEVLGEPGLAEHPHYFDNRSRVANRIALTEQLHGLCRRHAKRDLLAALERVGVPAGPINDIGEVFADPQVVARGVKVDLPHEAAKAGTVPTIASPIVMDGVRQVAGRPSPRLGEHEDEILNDPAWGGPAR
ncbi:MULTISPECIES: CaiB/BaiF CoA-transferase family protein [unclassified Bosea (in: a-proteobacteria)]|uniref:CaiB/BaiF CoA transferase family protein n=1 Tax=unclassified Bosea (in: a-proteobacteria) TaxID=2653178 RepID=UPI000954DEFB|nr:MULTISPECIES: CaiB/BaiF CoA-transferase family protein [unclassified Bosea (in: a-proteobacteria)]TAJ27762.1 MAG: CoA transferase [Bosea sp. (in: a-proteobacteria)]SIQ10636.1 Crotonobetainyl-CoA:carnitine CoA-transferase CaiB [Bosea sp. TND4EK4]